MTPSPTAASSDRPRRMAPIVPAIPRSLERKIEECTPKPIFEKTVASPVAVEKEDILAEGVSTASAQDPQTVSTGGSNDETAFHDRSDVLNQDGVGVEEASNIEGESAFFSLLSRTPLKILTDGGQTLPNATQDFGIEKYGFKLPPPFYPRKPPPAVISTEFSTMNEHVNVLQEPLQTLDKGDDPEPHQKYFLVNGLPLRPTAASFHAHPTPPSDSATSPTASSYKGHGLAQSISFHPQPTPPTDETPSPTSLPYQENGPTQNISFYPQPLSSHDTSPTHSMYQGYSYGPAPSAYSPSTFALHQASNPSEPQPGAPEQYYDPRLSYYAQPSNYPILGSHPPLTPESMPQHWNFLHESRPSTSTGGGYIPMDPVPLDIQSHYRSVSQSTLRSDSPSRANINGRLQRAHTNSGNTYELALERTKILDRLPHVTELSPSSRNPLTEYVLQNFNNENYADCRLHLTHHFDRFAETEWFLSRLLLAQSPILRDLLQLAEVDEDGKKVVPLKLTDRFITPTSMDSALRVFYGESPLFFTGASASAQSAKSKAEVSTSWMAESLAYAASGCLLHLELVVLRGLQIASKILDWDNLEVALSFGLESGLEREWNVSAGVIPAYGPLLPRATDTSPSSRVLITPGSSSDPVVEVSSNHDSSSETHQQPDPHSAFDLLLQCLRFVKNNFPSSWEFDVSARPLAEVDRLPVTAESRSPLSKSRLSRIQFGDHPSEATTKSGDHNVLISTILLSLPFIWLDNLLKSVGEPISRNLGLIIKERERRRQIVLQSQSAPDRQRFAARKHEWAEAGYEEYVESGNNDGIYLMRRYAGISHKSSEPSMTEPEKAE